jgi:hypothetical protein
MQEVIQQREQLQQQAQQAAQEGQQQGQQQGRQLLLLLELPSFPHSVLYQHLQSALAAAAQLGAAAALRDGSFEHLVGGSARLQPPLLSPALLQRRIGKAAARPNGGSRVCPRPATCCLPPAACRLPCRWRCTTPS